MATSASLRLPWDRPPRWPDRCIACGHEAPESTAHLRYDWGGDSILWPFVAKGRTAEADVPCCRACKADFERRHARRNRWLDRLVVGAILVCLVVVWVVIGRPSLILAFVSAILVLVPVAWWALRHPLALEISADETGIEYSFRDESFASEFAALNPTT